jgi:succinate dehydrogenase/fumarate reductase flavoprotein subunit
MSGHSHGSAAGIAHSHHLSSRLTAEAPGWEARADVIVVGSGVAGLTTALHARAAGLTVLLVTKAQVNEGSTRWAQGGIAAALSDDDSPEEHLRDTLIAGVGLCDEEAVRILVTQGPEAVRELISLGAHFDTDAAGAIVIASLTRAAMPLVPRSRGHSSLPSHATRGSSSSRTRSCSISWSMRQVLPRA